MEETAGISSEEELRQLLDEGKISKSEYEELRETMRRSSPNTWQHAAGERSKSRLWIGLVVILILAALGSVGVLLLIGLHPEVDIAIGQRDGFAIHPYRESGLHTVTVAIINRGKGSAGRFGVYFYRGDPNKVQAMTHNAGPIKSGGMWRERSMPFALNEGLNHIEVVLDPESIIKETDETNNRALLEVVFREGKIVEQTPSYPGARSEAGQ